MNITRREGANNRYDSIWSRLHKFIYLNAVDFSTLKWMFHGQRIEWDGPARFGATSNTLTNLGSLRPSQLREVFQISQDELELAFCRPYRVIAVDDAPVEYLRFCHKCINQGFHAAAFQIPTILRCPIHDVDLRDLCPSCRKPIKYQFRKQEFSVPYGCPCGFVLWPGRDAHRWPKIKGHAQEATFGELARWSKRYRPESLGDDRGDYSHVKLFSMEAQAMFDPIRCWKPEQTGSKENAYVKKYFTGRSPRVTDRFRSVPAVPVTMFFEPERFQAEEADNQRRILPDMRSRALRVEEKIISILGNHAFCTRNPLASSSESISLAGGFCQWEVSYGAWRSILIKDGLLAYQILSDGRYIYRVANLNMYQALTCAQTTLHYVHQKSFSVLNPLLRWLALEIFEWELWQLFIEQLQKSRFHGSKENLERDLLPTWTYPAISYAPGSVNRRPKVLLYHGISLSELEEMVEQKRGCTSIRVDRSRKNSFDSV